MSNRLPQALQHGCAFLEHVMYPIVTLNPTVLNSATNECHGGFLQGCRAQQWVLQDSRTPMTALKVSLNSQVILGQDSHCQHLHGEQATLLITKPHVNLQSLRSLLSPKHRSQKMVLHVRTPCILVDSHTIMQGNWHLQGSSRLQTAASR